MQGTESWRFTVAGSVRTVHPQGRFKADNGPALVAAALAGLGIAALPDFLIEEHLATGALVPLLVQYPMPEAGLYVVRPPEAIRRARCGRSSRSWWSGSERRAQRASELLGSVDGAGHLRTPVPGSPGSIRTGLRGPRHLVFRGKIGG